MASLIAMPNPISVCDGTGYGVTRLSFDAGRAGNFEIRVGGPNGVLFAQVGPTGSVETGKWVGDGHLFYFKDSANGEVLASALVRVGCPAVVMPPVATTTPPVVVIPPATTTPTATQSGLPLTIFGIDSKLVILGVVAAFFLLRD